MLRLIVVNGVRAYCDSIAEAIESHGAIDVVGTFADHSAANDALTKLRPGAVLLDVSSPTSLDTVRAMTERVPDIKVIGMGVSATDDHVVACARAGVAGYVPVECPLGTLADEILAACRGELRCPQVAGALLRAVSTPTVAAADPIDDKLSPRERQVVGLIEQGLSNKEIAVQLGLGVSTIKHHVHSILNKLQVRRRGQIAAFSRQQQPPIDRKI